MILRERMILHINNQMMEKIIFVTFLFIVTLIFFRIYSIQFSSSVNGCLPFSVSIINKLVKEPRREQLFSYLSHSAEPYFANGVNFHKLAAAIEGDVVDITKDRVIVTNPDSNYKKVYDIESLPMLNYAQIDIETFARTLLVPPGKIFALGTLQGSFDSRFWGLVDVKYIQGVGYGIF